MGLQTEVKTAHCGCGPVTDEVMTQYYHDTIVNTRPVRLRSINGHVEDPNGESIPGVLVEVLDVGAKYVRRVSACETSNNGRFCAPGLRDGTYEVRFSKNGFHTRIYTIRMKRTSGASTVTVPMVPA